ncbi:MAG: hypothetical protein ACKPKO_44525, partial [Candidatus Fonsibacter sp.]
MNAPTGDDQFPHDMSSDLLWEHHLHLLSQGAYDFIFCGTPCETFSAARYIRPGPRPLRSLEYPYGLPKGALTPSQIEQVRMGTYFAFQTANILR